MKNLLVTCLLLAFVFYLHAQEFKNPDLQAMVNTERAFSAMAHDKNTRDAFVAFLNNESIMFEKGGRIVNGLTKWTNNKVGTEWLFWLPAYADISSSGDFGFTTGPWSFNSKRDGSKPEAYGDFITVWRKQPDNTWKIAMDIGVSHGEYKVDGHPVKTSSIKSQASKGDIESFQKEFEAAHNQFVQQASSSLVDAFKMWSSSEAKFFRQGSVPLTTADDAAKGLGKYSYQIAGKQLSSAGDMAFIYGAAVFEAGPGAEAPRQNFVQIWKKEKGAWKLVIDIIS